MKGPVHYRYMDGSYDDGVPIVVEFIVVDETPKGYWVVDSFYANYPEFFINDKRRWVSKTSNKRYCYPTMDEAKQSFIIRKKWQIKHAERAISRAKLSLMYLEQGAPEPCTLRFT